MPTRALAARMGTTASVPERVLCIELCGALQGLEGTYFRKDSHGFMRVMDSCSLSQAQRVTVESALSIANLYIEVARVSPDRPNDLLAKAFLLESQTILEEYVHDVGDVPVNCRPLTVLRILSAMETWRDRLTTLQRLYKLRNDSGTRLMESIYAVYSSVRECYVVDKVLTCCAGVLCRSISRWMSGFELSECDSQMIATDPAQGYRLVWIPPFFPKWIAEYILKIGKSWRSVDLRRSSENLDKARAIIASQLDSKCLYLQSQRYKLEHVVREVCRLVCGSVVHSFVVDHHLLNHFDAAHCLLLLHDAQFSLALYRQFCECTHGLRSKLSQRDASNALIAAAASSTTAQRLNFPLNLDALSSVNDTPNTSSRLQFVQPLRPVYRPKGPISDIFRSTENKYESLFHFIWPLEMSLLSISEHANAVRQTAARMSRSSAKEFVKSLRLTSALLSCCERVLLRIRVYAAEVVDQFFKRLRLWIDDAIDLDAVVESHNNYLDGLSSAFFLNNETEDIYGLIMSILQISHELSKHCLEIITETESAQQMNGNDGSSAHARNTYLFVTQAKLQKILLELHSRINDLNKQQSNSMLMILLSILE
ncbi:Gamma-tubulin complex component [Trichostrongylus colubriformis]|uniref:Gamma-tubulin complex component n=1 Tax=Trichostrongylus colubriformis TaxID=6319 RepID=A0AAN8F761_TRICO